MGARKLHLMVSVSAAADLAAPLSPISNCAGTELMMRHPYGLQLLDSATHFTLTPQVTSSDDRSWCEAETLCRMGALAVNGIRRERRRRASLPEAHIQPDALVAVQSALMAQVSSAGEEVQENEDEGEALTVKGNRRDRRRRASLPEAHIQPDALA